MFLSFLCKMCWLPTDFQCCLEPKRSYWQNFCPYTPGVLFPRFTPFRSNTLVVRPAGYQPSHRESVSCLPFPESKPLIYCTQYQEMHAPQYHVCSKEKITQNISRDSLFSPTLMARQVILSCGIDGVFQAVVKDRVFLCGEK